VVTGVNDVVDQVPSHRAVARAPHWPTGCAMPPACSTWCSRRCRRCTASRACRSRCAGWPARRAPPQRGAGALGRHARRRVAPGRHGLCRCPRAHGRDGFHPGEPVYRYCARPSPPHRRAAVTQHFTETTHDPQPARQDPLHHRRQPRHRPGHRLRAAADGANIVLAAKTTEPNPKLPGTLASAAAEIEAAGGQALAVQTDIRDETPSRRRGGGRRWRASAASTSSSTTPARSA
jgi:hypothetical protein